MNLKNPDLSKKLDAWETYYNKQRCHSMLGGKTPWQRYKELEESIPSLEAIQKNYDPLKEPFVPQNYSYDQAIKQSFTVVTSFDFF